MSECQRAWEPFYLSVSYNKARKEKLGDIEEIIRLTDVSSLTKSDLSSGLNSEI